MNNETTDIKILEKVVASFIISFEDTQNLRHLNFYDFLFAVSFIRDVKTDECLLNILSNVSQFIVT